MQCFLKFRLAGIQQVQAYAEDNRMSHRLIAQARFAQGPGVVSSAQLSQGSALHLPPDFPGRPMRFDDDKPIVPTTVGQAYQDSKTQACLLQPGRGGVS